MNVRHVVEQGDDRTVPGPADLHKLGPSDIVMITGEHTAEHYGAWAAPIGMAVLRGVKVGRA
ncbi:hypothetical protein Acy02nite_68610 [Actinoplanes cyaneus]|uniref:Uncharacterized protein n=1 Tax=Actinoplanes cyaneus TaxID=52696 RepID=A0A919IVT2_9ACTN|nr:hypothetical protein [Actinoplanes cyaneus]MCW2139090.1 hypothetical protein [Actinoplanes cyaneus]GID68980.1 hypothetical protein Acy02nite_68610 [Actinoplanes cyaneus]